MINITAIRLQIFEKSKTELHTAIRLDFRKIRYLTKSFSLSPTIPYK